MLLDDRVDPALHVKLVMLLRESTYSVISVIRNINHVGILKLSKRRPTNIIS